MVQISIETSVPAGVNLGLFALGCVVVSDSNLRFTGFVASED